MFSLVMTQLKQVSAGTSWISCSYFKLLIFYALFDYLLLLLLLLFYSSPPPPPQMLPLSTNIREAYKKGLDTEQFFIQNLALFICTFLKEHQQLIESKVSHNAFAC